jgi:hypothetical protein
MPDFVLIPFEQRDHHSLESIAHDVHELFRKLSQLEGIIMSAISDFNAAITAFFDRQDAAITDLQGDVKNLSDQIVALQNTQGVITAEDQALLDGIQARAKTVSDKLDALDALTPPVVPVNPVPNPNVVQTPAQVAATAAAHAAQVAAARKV